MLSLSPLSLLIPQEPPFIVDESQINRGKRQSDDNNNFRYYGYIPELLEMIKVLLEDAGIDFTYEIEPRGEGDTYGRRDPVSGQWNGMIEDLIEGVSNIRNRLTFLSKKYLLC